MADDITMSSADARQHWAEVLEQAHHHGPVRITLNRKPYAVLVSNKAWHADWAEDGRDGDGNLILRYKPSGGLYRLIPVEDG